ncbi:hypothetical protein DICVIV_10654 [Dictyocaulus viviparus]|uniref:Uncharacterized protein n=1 Tax=Dictyocaulus viviparus TaxID=29172 RepID=A0A0D8XHT4_DICVI|nr:hypothetical protein DICVIV_10654 [Dictyocaulus viviparus]
MTQNVTTTDQTGADKVRSTGVFQFINLSEIFHRYSGIDTQCDDEEDKMSKMIDLGVKGIFPQTTSESFTAKCSFKVRYAQFGYMTVVQHKNNLTRKPIVFAKRLSIEKRTIFCKNLETECGVEYYAKLLRVILSLSFQLNFTYNDIFNIIGIDMATAIGDTVVMHRLYLSNGENLPSNTKMHLRSIEKQLDDNENLKRIKIN